MKSSVRFSKLLQVIFLAYAAYLLQACQEFIHDSFDTFQGVIVDESGNPVPNIRLSIYSYSGNYFGSSVLGNSSGNRATTNDKGEFKLVVPSRNREDNYYLIPPADRAFEVEQFGSLMKVRELTIPTMLMDRDRVIDLGKISLVNP